MGTVLGLAGIIALYLLVLYNVPQRLPVKAVKKPLRWAHWASSLFVPACLLLSQVNDWSIRYPWFFVSVIISSGLLASLRVKLQLISSSAHFLASVQARAMPWVMPILFLWAAFGTFTPSYRDASVSVEVDQHTSFDGDITTFSVSIYQVRCILFERRVGDIFSSPLGFSQSYTPGFWKKQWWETATDVTLDLEHRKGTVYHGPEDWNGLETVSFSY